MLRLLLFIAFLLAPVAEIWLLFRVGEVIGGWQTVLLLLATCLLGVWLVQREGQRAWRSVQEALTAGRLPERELFDGVLVVMGGALLVLPGLLSDALGLFLVLPVTRAAARRTVSALITRRIRSQAARHPYYGPLSDAGLGGPGFGAPGGTGTRPPTRIVHGEVIREDRADPAGDGAPPAYPAKPGQGG